MLVLNYSLNFNLRGWVRDNILYPSLSFPSYIDSIQQQLKSTWSRVSKYIQPKILTTNLSPPTPSTLTLILHNLLFSFSITTLSLSHSHPLNPISSLPSSFLSSPSLIMSILKSACRLILTASLIRLSAAAALAEINQIYYGVWVDTDVGYSDTPSLYNTRLGRNASVFHIAQNMPLSPYNYTTGAGGPAPEYLIENTATDASVFITIYPSSLTILADNDFTVLANQILACQSLSLSLPSVSFF